MKFRQMVTGVSGVENLHAGIMLGSIARGRKVFAEAKADAEEAGEDFDADFVEFLIAYCEGIRSLDIGWLVIGKPNLATVRNLIVGIKRNAEERKLHAILPDLAKELQAKTGVTQQGAKLILAAANKPLATCSVTIEERREFNPVHLSWQASEHLILKIK